MFRKIEEKDKKIYFELAKEFYSSDAVIHGIPESFIENTFCELMRSREYAECFIFEEDGVPCGYALLAKTFSQEGGGLCIWVEELYLRPAYRGRGIGSDFLKYLDSRNVPRLRLEVERENIGARKLYLRRGFSDIGYVSMIREKHDK